MQNITAARLLLGFLRPAAGEWCAPLSLGQALGLLSRLRFSAAWVAYGMRERGPAEVGWDWLWALPPTVSERESVKTSREVNPRNAVLPKRQKVLRLSSRIKGYLLKIQENYGRPFGDACANLMRASVVRAIKCNYNEVCHA